MEKLLGISCGIFQEEISFLIDQNQIEFPFIYLDSELHMKPELLHEALDGIIKKKLEVYETILLVYGDCHPYMTDAYDSERVKRVEGINCCNIILEDNEYRKLRKEGAFFVFYDWILKWQRIFVEDIGLTEALAPEFMNAMHTSIIYLDTAHHDVPYDILEEMSAYFQLPYTVLETKLDILLEAIILTAEGSTL